MDLSIALVPLAHRAQIVLPYDPSTAPAPVVNDPGGTPLSLYIGAGIACLVAIVLFVALKRRAQHRRQSR